MCYIGLLKKTKIIRNLIAVQHGKQFLSKCNDVRQYFVFMSFFYECYDKLFHVHITAVLVAVQIRVCLGCPIP